MRFNNKNWELPEPIPPTPSYAGLKFTSTGNSKISMKMSGGASPNIKYSLDGGKNWILWNYSSISLANGETICFKGNNPNGLGTTATKYCRFEMTGSLAASGNIMGLLDDGACERTTLTNYCFNRLFLNCSSLTSGPTLPAPTLLKGCYRHLFNGCTNLKLIISYAQNISATNCLEDWVSNVSSTGDFYNLGGATYSSGTSGIPANWTVHTSLN